jgi:flagellar basal-body rod protein FlgF
VSNNVANASTAGYKQDALPQNVGKPLDLLRLTTDANGQSVGTLTLGPTSGLSQLDLSQGPLQQTQQPLDMALSGPGFFAVKDANGQVGYTRDGGFSLDATGTLRSRDGSSVLDASGQPIHLASTDVTVGQDGSLQANGAAAGQLGMYEFAPGTALRKLGQGLLVADDASSPTAASGTRVQQGVLEGSNVDLSQSMVAMMDLARAYEANQRLLQIQDQSLARSVNDVGKI